MRKNILFKLFVAVCIFITGFATNTKSQDFSQVLRGGVKDASSILDGYIGPLGTAVGAGMNSGWYNTAKAHSMLGFDLTLSASLIMAPSDAKNFTYNNGTSVKLIDGTTSATSPTIFGSKTNDIQVGISNPAYNSATMPTSAKYLTTFNLPQGMGVALMAVPNLQLRVGIFKSTDIIVRYVPKETVDKFSIGLWGVGFLHDVKQWIPVVNLLPFDLSVQAGYSKLDLGYNFPNPTLPTAVVNGKPIYYSGTPNIPSNSTYANQGMSYSVSAWNVNAIISKKLLFFTPYLGVGYQSSTANLAINGKYPLVVSMDPSTQATYIQDVDGPSSTVTASGAKATIGFQLKFFVITLHADYTMAKYSVATAGLGFTFR